MSKSTCKAAKPAPVECIALSEDWNAGWRFETNGKFTGGADPRGLYSVRHPFAESQTGDRADLVRSLSVPREWTGPVILSFFATDNHHGTGYDPAKWPHYVGADIFKGHRFLQVLVAGQMVWEQDVAESDSPGWRHGLENAAYENIHHIADLTGLVKPGQTAPLILRVLDKTGSGVALPGDVHQGHYWEPVDYDRTVNNKWFDFTGWWGDVTLSADRSTAAQVQPTFAGHIRLAGPQLAPRPAEGPLRVELAIARAETLPAMPYPLWGGVPFPAGAAQDAGNIRLLDENGEDTPCQVQVCSRWPQDGSVQWAWLNVMALPGQKKFTMECGKAVARPPAASSLNITSANGRCTLRTGAVTVVFAEGQPALIESIQLEGRPPFGPITGILNQQMLGSLRRHRAVVRVVKVEEDGPVRASIRLEGDLTDEQGRTFGPFTARLTAWSGSALLGFSYRIFQQTDQLVAIVDDLLLEVALPCQNEFAGSFTLKTFGRPLPEGQVRELELRQPYGQPGAASPDAGVRTQNFAIIGKKSEQIETGEHAPGWVDLRGRMADGQASGLACGVRWFWQQAPKSLTVTPGSIIVGLFARRQRDDWALDSPLYFMTRGEAKRHYLWLLPHAGDLPVELINQVQAAWDARPHLLNGAWIAQSGVLGNFVPHNPARFSAMDRFLRQWDKSELGYARYGIRDFRETVWCQNYRGRAANGLLEYFESGRGEWQDYFEQVMNHNLDIDTIHFDPEHPAWVGAIRSYSPYHTTGGPSHGINSNCQDQFLHYFFAGEPDSLDEARQAAAHIAGLGADLGRSARAEGWPLGQMALAWLWTDNPAYKKAADGFLDYAWHYTHPRRGAYDEIHSTFSHRGIVPFMTGYLGFGLIRYHEATGSEKAAKLLVALAEATVSETGDGNGGFWYSPSTSQRIWGGTSWSALVGGMLAYAYRLTGTRWFAEQAALCHDRLTTDPKATISLDMAPLLGELLAGLELAETRGDLQKGRAGK